MGRAQRWPTGGVLIVNAIRIAISAFILVLVCLCVAGWIWTGIHQPPAKAAASHLVLGIAILSGLIGLVAVWRRPTL